MQPLPLVKRSWDDCSVCDAVHAYRPASQYSTPRRCPVEPGRYDVMYIQLPRKPLTLLNVTSLQSTAHTTP